MAECRLQRRIPQDGHVPGSLGGEEQETEQHRFTPPFSVLLQQFAAYLTLNNKPLT